MGGEHSEPNQLGGLGGHCTLELGTSTLFYVLLTWLTHGSEEQVGRLGLVQGPEHTHQLGQEVVVVTVHIITITVTALQCRLRV